MGKARRQKSIEWYVLCIDEIKPKKIDFVDIYWWEPKLARKEIVNGEWTDVGTSLYPGYVFVGSRSGWRYIEDTQTDVSGKNKIKLVRPAPGQAPHRMTEDELDRVREMEVCEIGVEPSFVCGQGVYVCERARSSYAGMIGKFVEMVHIKGGKYARIVIDLFGEGCIDVRIPVDYLRVV